jgi:hypothetical protein
VRHKSSRVLLRRESPEAWIRPRCQIFSDLRSIEANKLVQYSLLAEWRRVGKAPDHAPVDLAGTIRPVLDQLGTELIAELTETAALRASASCRSDVAKAVGKYAMAATCA